MQVLSSIVRKAVHMNPQLQMAMDEQIATYINDAGMSALLSYDPFKLQTSAHRECDFRRSLLIRYDFTLLGWCKLMVCMQVHVSAF